MNRTENWLGCGPVLASDGASSDFSPMRRTIPIDHGYRQSRNESGYIDYGLVTFAELALRDREIDWIVDQMIVARQPCVYAGARKTLKTSTAVDLAISIATATPFLGTFRIPVARRVAFISGESGDTTLNETADRICLARNMTREATGDMALLGERLPKFGVELHLLSVRHMLETHGIEVLIIDPAYLCMPGADAGNMMVQGQLLSDITDVCKEAGTTFILLHHCKSGVRKRNPFEPPGLDDIAWAGFAEYARQWVLLGERESFAPDDPAGVHRLWLSVGGSSGQSGLKALDIAVGKLPNRHWKVNVCNPDEAGCAAKERKADAKRKDKSQNIERDLLKLLDAMARFPDGETKTELSRESHLSGAAVGKAIEIGLSRRQIVPCQIFKGNHKSPRDAYKLAGDDNETGPARPVRQDQSDNQSDS